MHSIFHLAPGPIEEKPVLVHVKDCKHWHKVREWVFKHPGAVVYVRHTTEHYTHWVFLPSSSGLESISQSYDVPNTAIDKHYLVLDSK